MAPRTAGTELGSDYLSKWGELARWAVDSCHGAAARFAIMFALALKWPTVADGDHIKYLRRRVWLVTIPSGVETQRVALFDDGLIEELLNTVACTDGLSTPVFPRLPCGSRGSEVWAHTYASRREHRGCKNFVALCRKFGVAAIERWSPLDIYAASMCVFHSLFDWSVDDECKLLSKQLGTQSACRAHYSLHWFRPSSSHDSQESIGHLWLDGDDTSFSARSIKDTETNLSTRLCTPFSQYRKRVGG